MAGIDRSGMLGILIDVHNIGEKATAGALGINALFGGPAMSRFAARNATASLLGPTSGLVESGVKVSAALGKGEFRRSDLRQLRRLLPYQNLFYLRWLLTQVQDATAEQLDLPGR